MTIYNDSTMDVLVNGVKQRRFCEFDQTLQRFKPQTFGKEIVTFPFGQILPHILNEAPDA